MNNYFLLTIEEQRQVLQAAEGRIGLPAQAIEKDLWGTTILQIVFTLPFADKLIFKGGTSLSKVGKTFLEKVFLLHELFSVAGHGANANRKSRHLYDLYQMMDKDFAITAVKDNELWENIRHHREIFTSVKDMDYTPDVRKRIVLIPREDIISVWEKDYAEMLVNMIYGSNKPTFNQIIEKMQVLQDRFRQ